MSSPPKWTHSRKELAQIAFQLAQGDPLKHFVFETVEELLALSVHHCCQVGVELVVRDVDESMR